MSTATPPPGGPVLAVCLGGACAAAHGTAEGSVPGDLRAAVQGTRAAVLVSTGCLGRCEVAAVAAVAHRTGTGDRSGPTVWLAGVQDPDRRRALRDWIADGGPAVTGHPDGTLPATLVPAVIGLGAPMRLLPSGG